jgi:uncharacterized small protein (DUF1192 family)
MSIEKLQAENARLKTEVEHLMVFCNSTLIPSKELQAENARLKAEVERLETFGADATLDNRILETDYAHLKAEVERLRASSFVTAVPVEQYERLVKAGDAMVEALLFEDGESCKEIADWLAAKEGKPSV